MVRLTNKIISDRDGRIISRFWKELFRLTQTRLAMSTSHHPQTDGQPEKENRTLKEMIRHNISYQQNNWDDRYRYQLSSTPKTVAWTRPLN
jgi:hypothetical protein